MDIEDIRGFTDLNVDHTLSIELLQKLLEYDYRVIALNCTVDESSLASASQKEKSEAQSQLSDPIPEPPKLSSKHEEIIRKSGKKLRVLSRVTISFTKAECLRRALGSSNLKKYDITSVLPKTQEAFQHASSLSNIDIVSFEFGITEYKPNRKLYKQVVDHGGYFEIQYSHVLQSSVRRQETITMAHFFYIYGKSKNVILTSGTSQVLEIRNPYDVANLGFLFGLSEEQAKCALSTRCRELILRAFGRKLGRTAITFEKCCSDEDESPQKKRQRFTEVETNDVAMLTENISSL